MTTALRFRKRHAVQLGNAVADVTTAAGKLAGVTTCMTQLGRLEAGNIERLHEHLRALQDAGAALLETFKQGETVPDEPRLTEN